MYVSISSVMTFSFINCNKYLGIGELKGVGELAH